MRSLLAAVLAGLACGHAEAHPHVWIDARLELELDGSSLHAIHIDWHFDELFSRWIETEFDRDGDRRFAAQETTLLEREAFAAVAELGFLTHLRVDGALRPLGTYRDFGATLDEGSVVYRFTLPVTPAVDLARSEVSIALYDETYYIDIGFADADPVSLGKSGTCRFHLENDSAHPIYFGLVEPIAARLSCAGS